ncbi:MAG: hypothetical protein JO316_25870 [Abitibacteriaceae bacterium]|nr:hypothetical protein [Abditibacteriaceae bacterium]
MTQISKFYVTAVALILLLSVPINAAPAPVTPDNKVGVVCHVKVLSDKVEDVSSLEAWKKSFIKDGMTDEQKAMAVWNSVVKFQFQDMPPKEYLQVEDLVLDPIKQDNVYGYSFCSVASASVLALARYAGLQARGWTINGHVVPEVFWDGQWHMLDASLITYFPKPDGKPAGVEEIVAGVKDWYAQHPDYQGNDDKLRQFMANGGWRKGPEVLAHTPFYDDNGWLPAATHGWYSTMQEYSGKGGTPFPYEAGYSQGYQVNVQLRQGERLTRNWSNKGLHVNMNGDGDAPGAMTEKVGQGQLRYSPRFGDLAPGRLGNGTLEYEVPLASGAFRYGAMTADNLASISDDKQSPALHLKDVKQPGVLVLRMPSSYVYLSGDLTFKAVVPNGGQIVVAFSDNNGLDWKDIASITTSGQQHFDLKPLVFRRYDYRLKFTLKGKGTGLNALNITHDIQHSQRPLPAVGEGANTISFSSDTESTITIEGSTSAASKGKQLLYTDFHPELKGIAAESPKLTGGEGSITFPVETPGAMKRLRIGVFYRARDKADAWDVQVSFDRGKSFKTVDHLAGPTVSAGRYMVVTEVPVGTRSALVRFAGTQRNTTYLYNIRINADYKEPSGGFKPVKVTYNWEENGQAKQDVHIVRQPDESYRLYCGSKPTMKSIMLELAP